MRVVLALALLLLATAPAAGPAPRRVPLDRAFAHNDYVHARPLLGALELGFGGVEADVYLVNGVLLVAHDRDSVRADRTLEGLYLDPLRAWIGVHRGRVHPGRGPLLLLIDVKSDADSTYAALDIVLRRYSDILRHVDGGTVVDGPVFAVISGNRALETMRLSASRFAAYDGRLPDLDHGSDSLSSALMPLVSDRWDRITSWRGEGPPPTAARRALANAVGLAHAQGRRIRFWDTPDRDVVWRLLYRADVDLIGTDDLEGLRGFLFAQRAPPRRIVPWQH